MKVSIADNETDIWSTSNITFTTKARKPDQPPKISNGGFCVEDNNDVFIYWIQLPKHMENGPNASYVINIENQNFS